MASRFCVKPRLGNIIPNRLVIRPSRGSWPRWWHKQGGFHQLYEKAIHVDHRSWCLSSSGIRLHIVMGFVYTKKMSALGSSISLPYKNHQQCKKGHPHFFSRSFCFPLPLVASFSFYNHVDEGRVVNAQKHLLWTYCTSSLNLVVEWDRHNRWAFAACGLYKKTATVHPCPPRPVDIQTDNSFKHVYFVFFSNWILKRTIYLFSCLSAPESYRNGVRILE